MQKNTDVFNDVFVLFAIYTYCRTLWPNSITVYTPVLELSLSEVQKQIIIAANINIFNINSLSKK